MSQNILLKVKLFSAFAHPVRLRILEELKKKKEMCVSELVGSIKNVSQSQVSNHLICLRDCGLVSSRREWRRCIMGWLILKWGNCWRWLMNFFLRFLRELGSVLTLKKGGV